MTKHEWHKVVHPGNHQSNASREASARSLRAECIADLKAQQNGQAAIRIRRSPLTYTDEDDHEEPYVIMSTVAHAPPVHCSRTRSPAKAPLRRRTIAQRPGNNGRHVPENINICIKVKSP